MGLSSALFEKVPGWFSALDQDVFRAILKSQDSGHILEIGVYQGKSAIFIENFRKESEEFHICDVFDSVETDSQNNSEIEKSYENLTFLNFKYNFERFHSKMPIVHVCDSTKLPNEISNKNFRFIHIDGSHLYDIVKSDLKFASEHLQPDYGVIAMDDFRAAHTTGVAAAMWESVINGNLVPILITPNKAYLSNPNNKLVIENLLSVIKGQRYEIELVDAVGVFFYRLIGEEDTFTNQRFRILRLLVPPIFVDLLQVLRRKIRDAR